MLEKVKGSGLAPIFCNKLDAELFCETNLAVKRPGTGLSPMRWDEVLGSKAPRDFEIDEVIEL